MDAQTWVDVQEALLWTLGPVLNALLVVLVAGGILSVFGVIVLDTASRVSR